ncbi:MAG: LamG-like jellyroll fold domain-containing protein [Verrucomicrobiota bacterium]
MKHLATFLLLSFLSATLSLAAESRTWTSTDGKTMEAELVSSTDTEVTIRRSSDGRRFTFPLDRLSQTDRDWVSAQSGDVDSQHPLPKEIAVLVAERGKVLFEDDFNREDSDTEDDLGEPWNTNSKSRAQGEKQNDLVNGELVMTISPKADHAISTNFTTTEPFNAAVTYVRMKLEDGESLKLAFNDKSYEPVHAGHINGVTITPDSIKLDDEREGRFGPKVYPFKSDPSKKDEIAAIIEATSKSFPLDLKIGEWHDVVTLHDGETLTTYINGEEVASFTSPGFAHPTKSMLAFAVPKRAVVDNLKLWSLTPPSDQ